MNAGDIGKALLGAQDEISSLKKQLAMIATPANQISDSKEAQQIYTRLTYTIKKFEDSLQTNVDKIITHNMTQVDSMNPQKLPVISKPSSETLGVEGIVNEYQPFYLQQQKRYKKSSALSKPNQNRSFDCISSNAQMSTRDKSFLRGNTGIGGSGNSSFINNINNKSFEQGRAILQSSMIDEQRQKSASVHNRDQSKKIQRFRFGRISKPAQVLPPEIRNNPFADGIAITESEIYCGLYNLINKGIVPKDVDIMPAFVRGVPPLQNRPAKMHEFKEKLIKQDINMDQCADLMSIKLDIMRLTQPEEKIENKKNSIKQQEKQIIISKPNILQIPMEITETDQPRKYPEVLDAYSLHHLIVRKGKVLEESPEFLSYKRIYQIKWGQINMILKEIEYIAIKYSFPIFYIDGKKVAELGDKMSKPKEDEILDCIVNQSMVNEYVNIPRRKYQGPKGKQLAIIKIQSFVRGYLKYKEYQRIKSTIQRVKIIQQYGRIYLCKVLTKQMIKQKNNDQISEFKEMSQQFKLEWNIIKLKKRIEIHFNSFSFHEMKRLTMDRQLQRENVQITRVFGIKDPLVTIIYICPFNLSEDISNYYFKILELGEVQNFRERLFFVSPENCDKFPSHFSLSQKLLYSPQALKRIKKLIKNKTAYIVPGYPSSQDIKLSIELNVPLFSGDPQVQFTSSTKSASRRIFQSAQIDIPPGALEIYDETEFINTLTVLISSNPNVPMWLFKIDDEFGGRGLASFSIESIPQLQELLKENKYQLFDSKDQVIMSSENKQYITSLNIEKSQNEQLISKIKPILNSSLQYKTKIAIPSLFNNSYAAFIKEFLRQGGIIEASFLSSSAIQSPSISFLIEPSGEINLIAAFDKIQGQQLVNIGCQFPSTSFPKSLELSQIAQQIGSALYSKGVFGYVSADFVVYGESNQIYGIGIDCFMNNNLSSFFYFDYLMKGKINKKTGSYFVNLQESIETQRSAHQEERSYFYCPFLYHPGLMNVKIKTFFQMCRYESIQFDLERKFGATFLLVDVLQAGGLGILTIGDSMKNSAQLMNMSLTFLMKQAGNITKNYSEPGGQSRTDCIDILDVVGKIRLMVKKMLRETAASVAKSNPSNSNSANNNQNKLNSSSNNNNNMNSYNSNKKLLK